jgi:hypothetical protein
MQGLYEALSPTEQQRFNFDVSQIHWQQYFQEIHIPGIKRHVLKLEDGAEDGSETDSAGTTATKQERVGSQGESEE